MLDDELRLVVLCCHPALDVETQVALTMRLGCGVRTASVAAAFLVSEPTMAARLTRAKKRIAGSGTDIGLPDDVAVEERMPAVRRTIQLAYAMGHTAGSGVELRDDDLAAHALRLARSLLALRGGRQRGRRAAGPDRAQRGPGRWPPDGRRHPGAAGRRRSRAGGTGRCSPRASRSSTSLRPVLDGGRAGPLAWQAAIAAEHAVAPTFADTDWARIVACYDALLTIEPSPTIAVGRCVAVSYVAGAAAGLADLDEVIAVGGLERYPYAHAARAQMLDRLGRPPTPRRGRGGRLRPHGAERTSTQPRGPDQITCEQAVTGRGARRGDRADVRAASGDGDGVDDDVVGVPADLGLKRRRT